MMLDNLPDWAQVMVALLLAGGGLISLVGSFGLLRLGDFLQRLHASTLVTTLGTLSVLAASMLAFSLAWRRLVLHEILIALFVTIGAPVANMLLARVELYRTGRLPGRERP